jgi:hypothetical protein
LKSIKKLKGDNELKKIYVILIVVLLLVLIGCSEENTTNTIESDTWKSVVNKEWSNLDVWAGSGLYFHEEDGVAYCTFMIYGSGVRVAGYYKSIANVNEEGRILISLPQNMSTGYLSEVDTAKAELVEVELSVRDNSITLGDYEFKVHEGFNNYEYITW